MSVAGSRIAEDLSRKSVRKYPGPTIVAVMAELLEFEGERLCEAGHRKLGSGVRCPARSTEVATHRSDREQVPAALASHDWQHGASDVHHAVYVGCELLVDLFRRHFLKRSDETVARVVDEDIDSTKVIDSVRDDSRRGSWVGYVQRSRH
jgi:hypothetical protein